MNGVGNNITARQYAQTACQIEPNNLQYLMLLQQLQGGQTFYRTTSQTYGSPSAGMQYCYNIIMCNCLLNLCCGFRIC